MCLLLSATADQNTSHSDFKMLSFIHTGKCILRQNTLRTVFASYSTNAGIKERIEGLVKDKKIVVFMKGTPEQPRCGFSNAVVQILKFHGVEKYDAHDVLSDEDIRQGDYTDVVDISIV